MKVPAISGFDFRTKQKLWFLSFATPVVCVKSHNFYFNLLKLHNVIRCKDTKWVISHHPSMLSFKLLFSPRAIWSRATWKSTRVCLSHQLCMTSKTSKDFQHTLKLWYVYCVSIAFLEFIVWNTFYTDLNQVNHSTVMPTFHFT